MSDALEHHKGSVCSEDWIFINFRFADNIVANAEEEEELINEYNMYKVRHGDWA